MELAVIIKVLIALKLLKQILIILNLRFTVHYDFTKKDSMPFQLGTGNRIATALFYVRKLF